MAMPNGAASSVAMLATLVRRRPRISPVQGLVFRNVTLMRHRCRRPAGHNVVVTGNASRRRQQTRPLSGCAGRDRTGSSNSRSVDMTASGGDSASRVLHVCEVLMTANGGRARASCGTAEVYRQRPTSRATPSPASLPCNAAHSRPRDSNPELRQVGRHRGRSRGMAVGGLVRIPRAKGTTAAQAKAAGGKPRPAA